jgi:hypothetical protein
MFEEHRRARLCATQTSKSVFRVVRVSRTRQSGSDFARPAETNFLCAAPPAVVGPDTESAARNRSRFSLHRVN